MVDQNEVDSILDEVRGRLASGRRTLGMDQETLANLSGVARPMISDFERGARIPSLEHVIRICLGAGLNSGWVLSGEGRMLEADREHMVSGRRQAILDLPLDEVTRTYYLSRLDQLGDAIRHPDGVLQEAQARASASN